MIPGVSRSGSSPRIFGPAAPSRARSGRENGIEPVGTRVQLAARPRRRATPALAAALVALACGACERLPIDVGGIADAGQVLVDDPDPTLFVRDIALGSDFSCALLSSGDLACWGSDTYGQLGIDITVRIGDDCGGAYCATSPTRLETVARVVEVEAGDAFVCARSTHGVVSCWGSHRFGERGDFTRADRERHSDPARVLDGALELAVGRHHACVLGSDRRVRCWGLGEHGQLGRAASERCEIPSSLRDELGVDERARDVACATGPGLVEGLDDVAVERIVAGDFHTCAISAGQARCWGRDDRGQLGDGAPGEPRATPGLVMSGGAALGAIRELALGGGTSFALQASGESARWGDASSGVLGIAPADAEPCGDARCAPTPFVDRSPLTTVALGGDFGCGLDVVGRAWCWGLASEGRLGTTTLPSTTCPSAAGDAPCALAPFAVDRLPEGLGAIALGDGHACAFQYARPSEPEVASVHCWGRNDRGQLGIGRFGGVEALPVPVRHTR